MKILAIDTSTDACSCALLREHIVLEHFKWAPKLHTQLILPMIDSLLQEANITLSELDCLAFGRGPGSFTGVRMATSLVQAFGLSMKKPIVPVSTLQGLAQGAYRQNPAHRKVLATLDARLQEIYWGAFEVNAVGIMEPISEEGVGPIDSLPGGLSDLPKTSEPPHAEDIAVIAGFLFAQGKTVSEEGALPVYLRNKIV